MNKCHTNHHTNVIFLNISVLSRTPIRVIILSSYICIDFLKCSISGRTIQDTFLSRRCRGVTQVSLVKCQKHWGKGKIILSLFFNSWRVGGVWVHQTLPRNTIYNKWVCFLAQSGTVSSTRWRRPQVHDDGSFHVDDLEGYWILPLMPRNKSLY